MTPATTVSAESEDKRKRSVTLSQCDGRRRMEPVARSDTYADDGLNIEVLEDAPSIERSMQVGDYVSQASDVPKGMLLRRENSTMVRVLRLFNGSRTSNVS